MTDFFSRQFLQTEAARLGPAQQGYDASPPQAPDPHDAFAAIVQGGQPAPAVPFSPDEQRRVSAIMERLMMLLQNINFTAALPAFNQPHYWSSPVDISGALTLPAAVGAWADLVTIGPPGSGSTIEIQPSQYYRISGYGFNATGFSYDGSIAWRVTKNGTPVQSLDNITEQRGTLTSPRETFILLDGAREERAALQVRRVSAAVGTTAITGCLTGWSWRPLRPTDGPPVGISA